MLIQLTNSKYNFKKRCRLERPVQSGAEVSQKVSLSNCMLLSLLIIFSTLSFAQQNNELEPLITDRPDATESPYTVPKRFLQVETGAFYESFEENNIKTEDFTYNTTLVRYGLLNNLELRLGWNFAEGKTKFSGNTLNNTLNGFYPLLIGIKTTIAKENGSFPEIGLLLHTSHPFFASQDYKTKSTGVDFRFAFAHTLSEESSLSYNLGMAWEGNITSANYVYTIAYGYSLSNRLGAYAELYGNIIEADKAEHLWDAGLTYLINNNVQLDTTVGSSITAGQDILLSAGVSFRIPSNQN